MLSRIRGLHPFTHVALLGIVLLFVWLNLDHSRDVYNEHHSDGWRGGMRCGFPLQAWDAGQTSSARLVQGRLDLKVYPYGGLLWLGVASNLLVLGMSLLGAGWSVELLRAKIAKAPAEPRTYRRMHTASYAAALIAGALLFWVNARIEIQQIERGGKTDYMQTRGWPLDAYSATRLAEIEYRNAEASSFGSMLAYLEATPDAWYRRAHWNTQNIAWNLLIGVTLIVLAAYMSEKLLLRRQPVPVRYRSER